MTLYDALPHRPSLARVLATHGVSISQLEASVRVSPGQQSFDRMMIERAPRGSLDDVLGALSIPRVPVLDSMLDAASDLELPLIVGWDGARRCAKLYVNASDAPHDVRVELGERLGAEAVHVLGVNVFADGSIEHKRYLQVPDASGLGPPAEHLHHAAGDLCAGAVACYTQHGTLRAFFVALRPATREELGVAFAHLDGFSWKTLLARSPFPPASPRSIGISLSQPGSWTAYVKPRDAAEPELFQLEATARFRTEEVEVAVFVTPSCTSQRAYARIGDLAIAYRLVRGQPSRLAITQLLEWVVERARAEPRATAEGAALSAPPAPWVSHL